MALFLLACAGTAHASDIYDKSSNLSNVPREIEEEANMEIPSKPQPSGTGEDIPVKNLYSFDYNGKKINIDTVQNGLAFMNTSSGVGLNLRMFNPILRGQNTLPDGKLVLFFDGQTWNYPYRQKGDFNNYIDPLYEGQTGVLIIEPHNLHYIRLPFAGSPPYALENDGIVIFSPIGLPYIKIKYDDFKIHNTYDNSLYIDQRPDGGVWSLHYVSPLGNNKALESDLMFDFNGKYWNQLPKYSGTIYNMKPSYYNTNISWQENQLEMLKYRNPTEYQKVIAKVQANQSFDMPKMKMPSLISDYKGQSNYGDKVTVKTDIQ